MAQAISASRSESKPSEVDFWTSSASVAASHSDNEAASLFILRASWDALSRSCLPSVTYKKSEMEKEKKKFLKESKTKSASQLKYPPEYIKSLHLKTVLY